MALPQLMFKIWDGDPNERFTFRDMNRLGYNANIIAREAGVTQVTFIEADRTQQFRYDEVQKLENLTEAIAQQIGQVLTIERNWGPMRGITFRDFERIESNLYACYQRLGGSGDRIPDNKRLIIVSATLFPDSWTGSQPYIDLDVPMIHPTSEVFVFVPYYATEDERLEEQKARLTASIISDRKLRVRATGILPRIKIPIKIALGGLSMNEKKTLTVAGWSGNGPWTQDVTLSSTPEHVVVGMSEDTSEAESKAYAKAGIHASGVNGTTLTIRAIFEKPSVAIPIGIIYSTESVI